MLEVKPFMQRAGLCGPACLKMVLNYYKIRQSERELARLSGCTPSKGVDANGLLKATKKLGLKGFVKDFSDLRDIKYYVSKKKIPVIVDWFSADDGHYSVVVDIDKSNIYLLDPDLGHIIALTLKTFKRVWFDFPGDFISSKNKLVIRRMIVIHK